MPDTQSELFAKICDDPVGFLYRDALLSHEEETQLVAEIAQLPFEPFAFHGYLGKRRIVSFGWRYDYGRRNVDTAEAMPDFLLALRDKAACIADLPAEIFSQALVTEYAPGAGIGWHRDKAIFGEVIGISLLSSCTLRFRRVAAAGWERRSVTVRPRSAYLLQGPSRSEWEHSIPGVDALRYSVTFRRYEPGSAPG
jgi:alkylated DNA repair dioxygenase AlkB